jgi:hypothetical protein
MISLTPYQIFSVCHSIFLHYHTNYDYQKHKGKSRYSEEDFDKRKDKPVYQTLAREFVQIEREPLEYYVAWQHYNREKWVTSEQLINGIPDFELEWLNYSKHKEQNFKLDMAKLHSNYSKFVFDQLKRGEIHYQTLLILSKFTNIIDDMNRELQGTALWDSKYYKIQKFKPFFYQHDKIADEHFKQYISEKLWAAYPSIV